MYNRTISVVINCSPMHRPGGVQKRPSWYNNCNRKYLIVIAGISGYLTPEFGGDRGSALGCLYGDFPISSVERSREAEGTLISFVNLRG